MQTIAPEKLFGGDSVKEAAKIFVDVLKAQGTVEQNNVVLANSALALQVVNPEKELNECVEMARESLQSGKALEKLSAITNIAF
jgi:anthranilate phosphoribosyltransferase